MTHGCFGLSLCWYCQGRPTLRTFAAALLQASRYYVVFHAHRNTVGGVAILHEKTSTCQTPYLGIIHCHLQFNRAQCCACAIPSQSVDKNDERPKNGA